MNELRTFPGVHEVRDAYTAGGLIAADKQQLARGRRARPEARRRRGARRRRPGGREAAHDRRARGARRRQAAGRAHVRRAGRRGTRCAGRRSRSSSSPSSWCSSAAGCSPAGSRCSPRWRRSRARCSALNALASAAAISEFAVNVVTLLGLGLAVDYSLLVIARFREERAATRRRRCRSCWRGRSPARAVRCSSPASRSRSRSPGCTSFADPLLSAMALGGVLAVAHGDDRRPHARARADRGRAPPHPVAGHAHLGLAARAPERARTPGTARRVRAAPSGGGGARRHRRRCSR